MYFDALNFVQCFIERVKGRKSIFIREIFPSKNHYSKFQKTAPFKGTIEGTTTFDQSIS